MQTNKYLSLKNMEDAGYFLRTIYPTQASEIKLFILLQLYIPTKPSDLLAAKWINLNMQLAQWSLKLGQLNPNGYMSGGQLAFLSSNATVLLQDLNRLTGHGEFLFPHLISLKKADREKMFSEYIHSLWPYYRVEIDGFRYFFAKMAKKHSYFLPSFIQTTMMNNSQNFTKSYVWQRRTIIEWWSFELSFYFHNPVMPNRR